MNSKGALRKKSVIPAKELTKEDHERLNGNVEEVLQKSDFDHEELLKSISAHVQQVTSNAKT